MEAHGRSVRAGGVGRLAAGAAGAIGELLITVGVLIGLFLVWQLWWTDVTAGDQHRAEITALEKRWHATGTDADGAGTASASSGASSVPQRVAPEQTGPPPRVAVAPENTAWAILHVPAFDQSVTPVGEGVTREGVLNVIGAGHYPGTAMPGEVGNVALAGHRTTYGRPFHDIARLTPGSPIVLETQDAYYVYTVTSREIVTPDHVEVVAPVPDRPGASPTERMITLTACHPMYSAAERYVVHGTFAYWTKKSDGIPPALAGKKGA